MSYEKIHRISNYKSKNNLCEEKQVRTILGHPVKRIIRDRQGNIILNVGDLITFRALERVKQANAMDYLYSSVYRK